jgi:hypothetical protein
LGFLNGSVARQADAGRFIVTTSQGYFAKPS